MDRKLIVNVGFAIALAILMTIGWLSYRNMSSMIVAEEWERHSHVEILELSDLLSSLREVETMNRGFVITGDNKYLEAYKAALNLIERKLVLLRSKARDNPLLQKRLESIAPLIREKLAMVEETIELRRTKGFQAASQAVMTGRGKRLMDEIARLVAESQDYEGRILQEREAVDEAKTGKVIRSLLTGSILSLALLCTVFLLLKREVTRRVRSEDELRMHRDYLDTLVEERTAQLVQANLEAEAANTSLRDSRQTALNVAEDAIAVRRQAEDTSFELRREVVERKRMEDFLRESEERFRATFNQAAVGIGHVTPDGRWLRINQKYCDVLGYTKEELKSLTLRDITHPDDLESSMKHFQLLLDGKLWDYAQENRFIRKDGSIVWVNHTASMVSDADGNPRFAVSVVENISKRKLAEEEIGRLNVGLAAWVAELDAANKDLEAFNFTVAHDLRNPLNVISLSCQTIKELYGDQLPEECMDYIQNSYNGALHMSQLIEALLKFSRMGRVEPRREMVDLCKLAHEVVTMLKKSEPERQVDFRIADGITVDADANLVRVVLDNLLGNAWKYTGMQEKAVIEFGVTEIDGVQTYFVQDNGAGFDNADANELFMPFQRLPGAEEFKGSGIGLATVERIIQRHGGRIWAEGEPGKGATFFFTLQA